MSTTEQKTYHNYGRFDWKMKFPENRDAIRNADDDQIVKWWRFLPPALNDKYKMILLSDITYEFKKRFKSNK